MVLKRFIKVNSNVMAYKSPDVFIRSAPFIELTFRRDCALLFRLAFAV